MKNVIFQYYLNFNGVGKQGAHYPDEGIPKWAQTSSSMFEEYARIHGADYVFRTDRFVGATSNFFEVLRLYMDPVFDAYDNLLYVDADVIPKGVKTSVFDVVYGDVAGWPEWRHPELKVDVNWGLSPQITQRFADFGAPVVRPASVPGLLRMINSGVMLWSRDARLRAREAFGNHEEWFSHKNALLDPKWTSAGHSSHCLDQPFLNAMFNKNGFDVTELGIEWNRFPTNDENRDCVFAHYVGDHRYRIPSLFPRDEV